MKFLSDDYLAKMFENADIDSFINDLEEQNKAIVKGSVGVAGGLDNAKDILKHRPNNCNAYDIVYEEYGFIHSWFMIDHNITINLSDLEIAVKELEVNK